MSINNTTTNEEILIIGIIGLILFLILFLITIINYYNSFKLLTKFFFLIMSLMCLFELPRYIIMIIYQQYISLWGYSCHIFASYLFFLCLSIVILMWSILLELDFITNFIYSKSGIIIIDIILGIMAIIAIIFCLNSSSLKEFFDSIIYETYVFIECFSVLLYNGIISIYGIRLVLRFRNYIQSRHQSEVQALQFFQNAITRVTFMLVLTTICAFIRVSILLFKITLQHTGTEIHSRIFTKYGIIWFFWSDFIPRILGSIALLSIIVVKTPFSNKGSDKLSNIKDISGNIPFSPSSATSPPISSYQDPTTPWSRSVSSSLQQQLEQQQQQQHQNSNFNTPYSSQYPNSQTNDTPPSTPSKYHQNSESIISPLRQTSVFSSPIRHSIRSEDTYSERISIGKDIIAFYNNMAAEEDDIASRHYSSNDRNISIQSETSSQSLNIKSIQSNSIVEEVFEEKQNPIRLSFPNLKMQQKEYENNFDTKEVLMNSISEIHRSDIEPRKPMKSTEECIVGVLKIEIEDNKGNSPINNQHIHVDEYEV